MTGTKERLYDKKGYPIYPGDVLKIFHFVAARRREKRYMYKVAVERNGHMCGVDIGEIVEKGIENAHICRLGGAWAKLDGIEIVQGSGPGDLYSYRQRPRKV